MEVDVVGTLSGSVHSLIARVCRFVSAELRYDLNMTVFCAGFSGRLAAGKIGEIEWSGVHHQGGETRRLCTMASQLPPFSKPVHSTLTWPW